MKRNKNLCFAAICSLMLLSTACGSGSSNSSNSSNGTLDPNASALDTGDQYGQQPRDSTNTPAVADTAKNTGTNGNADPSGRIKNK